MLQSLEQTQSAPASWVVAEHISTHLASRTRCTLEKSTSGSPLFLTHPTPPCSHFADVPAAKGWVKEVSQSSEAAAESSQTSSRHGGKSGRASAGRHEQSASRRAYAVLEAAQAEAAKQIIRGADVVVCSCIGAGNDAFVRAIGGDQEG